MRDGSAESRGRNDKAPYSFQFISFTLAGGTKSLMTGCPIASSYCPWPACVQGVSADFSGKQHNSGCDGQALMRSRLDRVDAEHALYYQRFRFEVTVEIILPIGGPTLWPMSRQPR